MNTLAWNSLDFRDTRILTEDKVLSSKNNNVKKALVTIGVAILILGGLLIVSMLSVQLYKIYTSENLIKSALQMAKDTNRQVEIYTENRFNMTLNVTHNSTLELAGKDTPIMRITVYPKDYRREQVRTPNGQTITPYSINFRQE